MRTEERTSVKNSVGRWIFVGICVLIQLVWILVLMVRLNLYSTGISLASSLIAIVVVLRIYVMPENTAYKMPWIMLIMALPVLGLTLYLM